MNENNKKVLCRYLLFVVLLSPLFAFVNGQNITVLSDSANHNPKRTILWNDTLDKDYEVIYDTVYLTGDTIRKTDTLVRYRSNNSNFNYSIDFSISPFYCFTNIVGLSEESVQSAFKKQKAQSPLLSYRIGSNLLIQKAQHSLSIGIGIANFREIQNYKSNSWISYKTNYSKLDTIDSYYVIKGTDTSTVYVTKKNQYTRIDSSMEKNNYKNHYINIEVPIIYGYKKEFKNISIYLRTGFLFDFLINVAGKTISLNNINKFESIKKDIGFKKANMSLWLGVNIVYPIKNHINITAEPYFTQSILSIYQSNYSISQKLQSCGIRCGVLYKF